MEEFLNIKKQEQRFKHRLGDFTEGDRKLIIEALELAKKKHVDQKRDEGGPYVLHCIRVAISLIEEVGTKNAEAICAALLHDVIEDTDLDLKEVVLKFGERIGEIVFTLTRVREKDETEKNRYQRKQQHFLKIMQADKEIRAIKACDWLDNMRSWPFILQNHPSTQKFNRWFKEAENMYLPLAKTVSSKVAKKMELAFNEVILKWKEYYKEDI